MKTKSYPTRRDLILVALFSASILLMAAGPTSETKLTPNDPSLFRHFGAAVAIDGDTAVVGVPLDHHGDLFSGSKYGAVYIFVRNGGAWSQEARLIATDANPSSQFGDSVAISGDTIVVGALGDPNSGPGSGAAYVFVRSASSWTQQAKLAPNDPAADKEFGSSVAIENDTIAVGAQGDDEGAFMAGAVYVFTRSGSTWTQQAKVLSDSPRPGNLFGFSVALDGNTLAVGSPFDDDLGIIEAGAVYVFGGGGSIWTQQAEVTASDAGLDDMLGWSVAVSGDTLIAGAPQNDSAGESAGAAYVFVRAGGLWTQQAKLVANDATAFDLLGYSVGVSGNTAAVGSVNDGSFAIFGGAAYLFLRTGTTWTQDAEFTASDLAATDQFAYVVAVDVETVIVGAPFSDVIDIDGSVIGPDDGAAYVFDLAAPSNNAPMANSRSLTTDEDTPVGVNLTGTDRDGDTLTFTVLTLPTKGSLSGTPPNLSYSPSANATGLDSFTFKVSDGELDSGAATVLITITPVNDTPLANGQTATTDEEVGVNITLTGSDIDGDSVGFAVVDSPSKGILSGTPPNLVYTPNPNENGTDTFTFKVNDGSVDSLVALVSVNIAPVNDGPTISAIADVTIPQNSGTGPITFTIGDVDHDAAALVVTASSDNGNLIASDQIVIGGSGPDRTVTLTPATGQSGTATIAITVSDGEFNAVETFLLTVTPAPPANHPPVADASASEMLVISHNNRHARVELDGSRSSDLDGDPLTYVWFADDDLSNPVDTRVNFSTKLTVGTHQVVLRVSDGEAIGETSITVQVITVGNANKKLIEHTR